ncbi:MAG: hypothetical protein NXI26_26260 [bacterium]|uniref:Uncharacterized protein n=1 Tax=Phaeodactylibacter xiamenensis TaxID=1524460 RepID=A0A098RZ73_9BACT|nr:hypothetical protein [Phaeodactylibacter xiamenensis]KGE84808.1 hypothetical protein IX84_31715 [Phaeodactylibacter xiamenensis]MCR9055373.1 hypothetical protein [bacterium]
MNSIKSNQIRLVAFFIFVFNISLYSQTNSDKLRDAGYSEKSIESYEGLLESITTIQFVEKFYADKKQEIEDGKEALREIQRKFAREYESMSPQEQINWGNVIVSENDAIEKLEETLFGNEGEYNKIKNSLNQEFQNVINTNIKILSDESDQYLQKIVNLLNMAKTNDDYDQAMNELLNILLLAKDSKNYSMRESDNSKIFNASEESKNQVDEDNIENSGLSVNSESFVSNHTLYDQDGVILKAVLFPTGKFTECDPSYKDNDRYSTKKLQLWKIELILINGSGKALEVRHAPPANLNVIGIKNRVYASDYCTFLTINNPETGFYFPHTSARLLHLAYTYIKLKPNESHKATKYIYLYEDDKPIIESWDLGQYHFLEEPDNDEDEVKGNTQIIERIPYCMYKDEIEANVDPTTVVSLDIPQEFLGSYLHSYDFGSMKARYRLYLDADGTGVYEYMDSNDHRGMAVDERVPLKWGRLLKEDGSFITVEKADGIYYTLVASADDPNQDLYLINGVNYYHPCSIFWIKVPPGGTPVISDTGMKKQ